MAWHLLIEIHRRVTFTDKNLGMESGSDLLDGDNVWRDGFVSSFTMILLAEIADKTFFIAAILGRVLTTENTTVLGYRISSVHYLSVFEYPKSHAI